jgi:hypothetical protein
MFDAIKGALNKEAKTSAYADILKTTAGNSYEVRLLPNVEQPDKTFHHFYTYGWESFATGQYIGTTSPQTYGGRDVIGEARYRDSKHGTPAEKQRSKAIIRSEKWLVNAYVVNDPSEPENNGKVKVVRFGKQLHKIVMDAIEGEDANELGARIFDLSPNGCSLRIKVESQGEYPTYVSSKFLMPSAVDGVTTDTQAKLYESCIDLENVLPPKSQDEIVQMLDEHYYCKSSTPEPESVKPDSDLDEEVPMEFPAKSEPETHPSAEDPMDDDKVKELLQGLDDI